MSVALSPGPCPSDAELASFVDHRVSPRGREDVEAHIDRCEACRQLLTSLACTQPQETEPIEEHATEVFAHGRDRARFPRGTVVGRFVLLELIGAGGMGVVYTAYDPELDRKAALKLLRPITANESARQVLRTEAHAMARIQHPNVVTVHEVGTYRDQLFIAMERVNGITLRDWLRRGTHSLREALAIVLAAGEGLAAAHDAGIVHRDFKPENVLVADDGQVKVTDFGLAEVDASSAVAGGTPAYMPPESQNGMGHADARGDQFSFCVTLYEASCGAQPVRDRDGGVTTALACGAIQRAARPLRPVLRRGLATDPEQRYASMHELIDDLRRRLARRARVRVGLAAVAMIAAVAAASAYAGGAHHAVDPCGDAGARLAGSWNATRAGAARAAFAQAPLPFAEIAAKTATDMLDSYAAEWRAARTDACEATSHHEQSPELLDRRMACLDELAIRLRVLGDVFVTANRETVRRATSLVEALPSPQSCSAAQLLGVTPLPAAPAQRARIAAVTAVLDEAQGLFVAARPQRAAELTERVAPEALALGYPPLTADYLYLASQVAGWRGDVADERRMLRKTTVESEAAGRDALRVRALLKLVEITRGQTGDYDAAEQLFQEAMGTIRRLGMPSELEAELLDAQSRLYFDAGDSAHALPLQQRYLALEVTRGDPVRAAKARLLLAPTLKMLRRDREAASYADEAVGVLEAKLGADHPDAADAHVTRAKLRYDAEHPQDVLPELDLAYGRLAAVLGERHPDLIRAISLRAEVRNDLGQVDDAVALYRDAAAIAAEAFGNGSAVQREQLNNAVVALLGASRWQAGDAQAARVVELSDQFGDRDSVTVGDATLYRAVATQALGRPREAIPYFERAIEILGRRIGRTDHRVTRAIGELGVLLSDRDAAKAIALLDEAVANEAAAGDVEAGALAHRRQLEMLRARKH